MKKVLLKDLAKVIRSKNAGPYELTFDVIFQDQRTFEKVVEQNVITSEVIAELYKIPAENVISVLDFPPAKAIKATIVRPRGCGDAGDTDIYGAQQHAPLLNLEVYI